MDNDAGSSGRLLVPWEWDAASIWALLKVSGCSKARFAKRTGTGERTVTTWLYEGVTPSPELGARLYRLWADLAPWQRETFTALRASAPASLTAKSKANGGKEGITKRSEFTRATLALAGLAAVVTAPLDALGDALERITDSGNTPVDARLIAGHETLAKVLAEQFEPAHRDALLVLVDRHASVLLDLLNRPMRSDERRRLDALATGAHVQAGSLALHTHRRSDARRYLGTARNIADDSGDPALQALALAVSANPGMPWFTLDGRIADPLRAGQIVSGALDLAKDADGNTRAWLHRWMTVILAAQGDERGFRFHAEQADRALDQATPVEPVGFLAHYAALEACETGATEGMALRLLGHGDGAEAALTRALTAAAPEWTARRAMLFVDLAAVRVLQHAPEAACTNLVTALDLAGESGYWVTMSRVLGVRSTFPQPWAALPCVANLDERLRLT